MRATTEDDRRGRLLAASGAVAIVGVLAAWMCGPLPSIAPPDGFSQADVALGAILGRQKTACFLLHEGLLLSLLAVLALGGAGRRLADALAGVTARPAARQALFGLTVFAAAALLTLPVDAYRGFVLEHRFGMSDQSVLSWGTRWIKEVILDLGMTFLFVMSLVWMWHRWPKRWWVAGTALFGAVVILFYVIEPVVVAPWLDEQEELKDPVLAGQIRQVAERGGVSVAHIYVSKVSARTHRTNAYISGLGATRSITIYDTLLDQGSRGEMLSIIGHEVGHIQAHHLEQGMALAIALAFLGLALAARAVERSGLDAGDPTRQAIVLLVLMAFEVGTLPLANTISRRMEAQADWIALQLTDDPASFRLAEVDLSKANMSDLDPPALVVACLYTHPPALERLAMAERWKAGERTWP